MKKILLAVVAGWSFLCSGLAFAVEPASVEFLDSGKVLPTNLPFSEATLSIFPVRSGSLPGQ